ncbi:deoxyribodipyrimidine photolyase [Cloacibacterium normanense]|uniref:Deoxyribodipyrimidine photolyase n=1 Tax=Cloacibacterium normanense TaxID=237258 RepID=A0A2S7I7W9_9FLAO|nr:deoxyribodipyrimidine photo-lyase [Cloacibacterium normanense]PPZ92678.1 deoxyribodipyrimidine photolyase [Cloacibacterium normanense]
MDKVSIFWFRRDLRLKDNHGLFQALESGKKVLPIFIFDEDILDLLENKSDKRVDFIVQALQTLNSFLKSKNKGIKIFKGKPLEIYKKLSQNYEIEAVYSNEDYEPYAIKRDQEIADFLASKNINFHQFKDQVIFHKDEIVKADKKPYTVYTPYSKLWLNEFQKVGLQGFPSEKKLDNLLDISFKELKIEDMGFQKTDLKFEVPEADLHIIKTYEETRNFPAVKGTTQLGVHLRFGTISVRKLAKIAKENNLTFLKELIWREFFMQILYHFPKVVNHSFKPKYDAIPWENNAEFLEKWKAGKTGFPIVDAGMRELNATGFMHNRVRMITASFLIKHLLTDWRIGEAYFAEKLMDYDLSANNGNWQWCASSGCDAAPYFRIFNPDEQQKKFDPDFKYIKKWIPEFGTKYYPKPILEHKKAREKVLKVYKEALDNLD